jgi:hypothetical protein
MAKQVNIDGVEYTVSSDEGAERLRRDIAENNNGMGDEHQRRVMQMGARDLRALESEAEMREMADANKSGALRALLAGMSNDQAYQAQWLAEKRFPELADSVNLSDYYFLDEDNDLAYMDPYTGEINKEFKDGLFGTVMDTYGLVGPALQFVPEMALGAAGLSFGALSGGLPGAMAGGAGGTALGGSAGAAGRAGISAAFDGPPLNVGQLGNDLLVNSAFGSVPLGAGFFRGGRPILNKVSTDFAGEDGRNMLRTLLTEGGEDVDKIIAMADDKFGITLTRAEAQGIKTNAGQIQRYLQMQPSSQKLFDFYNDRALRMEDALNEFFDEIQAGKMLTGQTGARMQGMPTTGSVTPEMDLAEATQSVIKKLADKRQQRANKVYEEAFALDDFARSGQMGFAPLIDISDIGKSIKQKMDDPDTGDQMRAALAQIYKTIVDPTGTSLTGFKSETRALHNAVTEDLRALYETKATSEGGKIASVVANYKGQISDAIKANNPIYARAARIYDPEKGHLQILERGLLKNLTEAVDKGGATAAPLVQKMFTGKATAEELRRLRRLVQTEDPRVWQNLKADWLRTQLDDVIMGTTDPFGVPNKFLRRIGIRNPNRAFSGRGGVKRRSRKIDAFKEILSPEEFAAFEDALQVTQAISYIATQGGSPTQPLLALMRRAEAESSGLSRPVISAVRAIVEVPQRILIRGFDDLSQAAIGFQREAYEDALIQAIIDPKKALELREAIDRINPYIYMGVQSTARGVDMPEALEPTEFGPEGQIESMGDENLDLRRRMRELEEQAAEPSVSDSIDLGMGASFAPLPDVSAPSALPTTPLSPSLLPSEEDREIAMRRQQGIAGLMA